MFAVIAAAVAATFASAAQEQQKEVSLEEKCEEEADRLQRALDLEDWQTFRVDSTLKHDYAAMKAEYERMSAAKISNFDLYQDIQDKWMESIDRSYQKLFTPEQWALYLKQGGARAQKARAKRAAKKK